MSGSGDARAPSGPEVVLIEDDAALRSSIALFLESAGCAVSAYPRAQPALDALDAGFPGVVVTDLRMPGLTGAEVVATLRGLDPELPVIVVTAHGDVPTAIELIRGGAVDIIEKPFDPEALLARVSAAAAARVALLARRAARSAVDGAARIGREALVANMLVGESAPMRRLREDVLDAALVDAPALVIGETGAGKELIARCLHGAGARAGGPFIAVNAAAIPEAHFEALLFGAEGGVNPAAPTRRDGYFQAAHGGVLFLDELTSLPLDLQPKLLRALQEGAATRLGATEPTPLDFRVVSAATEALETRRAQGRFRDDLYFRLNTLVLRAPPLRERGEDALLLYERFLRDFARAYDAPAPAITAEDAAALLAHPWPGNVRELRIVAERVALSARRRGLSVGEALGASGAPARADRAPERAAEDAPPLGRIGGQPLRQAVDAFEKGVIRRALAAHQGDVAAVAAALGLPRRTLNEKMARHGLESRSFRDKPSG